MDYFKQQDTFIAKMKEDYENGMINIKALTPYFRWKFDDKTKNLSKRQIWTMYYKKNWASITKLTPKVTSRQLMNPFGDSMLDMVTISISLLTWRQSKKNFPTY